MENAEIDLTDLRVLDLASIAKQTNLEVYSGSFKDLGILNYEEQLLAETYNKTLVLNAKTKLFNIGFVIASISTVIACLCAIFAYF